MKKAILVSICSAFGFFGIMFWIFFVVIAFRNESIVADFKGKGVSEHVYINYGKVNYYLEDSLEVYISDLRFIFKTNKKKLSDIIKNDEFDLLLNKLNKYEYYANMGFETKYYTSDKKFVITKCEYWINDTSRVHYVIDNKYEANICNGRYYKGFE